MKSRNKISTSGDAAQAIDPNEEKQTVFVQLRLSPGLADKLRKAGSEANRKLPAEIIHRLQGSLGEPQGDLALYGWVDPGRDKALGELIGVLAGRVEAAGPISTDSDKDYPVALAMLKVAVADLLDRLGASAELSDDDRGYAAFLSRQLFTELQRPTAPKSGFSFSPEFAHKVREKLRLKMEGKD